MFQSLIEWDYCVEWRVTSFVQKVNVWFMKTTCSLAMLLHGNGSCIMCMVHILPLWEGGGPGGHLNNPILAETCIYNVHRSIWLIVVITPLFIILY